MCGITGFIDSSISSREAFKININKMQNAIKHRGPDMSGFWINVEDKIAFGHQRLSILDLSQAGSQPMKSHSSRFVVVFNGEIYNHQEIRQKIENTTQDSYNWKGHSDTETLIQAFEVFGIENTLELITGMFSIAIWDQEMKVLSLARDRMGEKPLYYGNVGDAFVFGSELKAIRKFPGFNNPINHSAVYEYFRCNYIPTPLSIYQDIFKLEPGTLIQFNFLHSFREPCYKKKYWSFSSVLRESRENQFANKNEAYNALENKLLEVINAQFLSDVPLGVFLSGGIDSSLVSSLSTQLSTHKLKTFTIGFLEEEYDESRYAEKVAEQLGTDHSTMIVTKSDALNAIEKLPIIFDEPFSDSSQIPTFLVCKAAKKDVTVVLTGDGADELFGGYNRYFLSESIWKLFSWMPKFARILFGKCLLKIPLWFFDKVLKQLIQIVLKKNIATLGSKIHKIGSSLLHSDNLLEFCMEFSVIWHEPPLLKNFNKTSGDNKYTKKFQEDFHGLDPISQMMAYDCMTYMPDDILCKVDRASMASSLETRAPFLDKEIIELALRMPSNYKFKRGHGKIPLKTLLSKFITDDLINRPKSGFAIPIGEWLRGPLKTWAEELLDPSIMDKQEILDVSLIQKIWRLHLHGKRDYTSQLWGVLMFQAWLRENT